MSELMRRITVLFVQLLALLHLQQTAVTATAPTLYRAGKFTNAAITDLAKNLGGEMGGHLGWFAEKAELFTFPGHDGLPLQGYYIPAPAQVETIKDSSSEGIDLPVLIHCAGWSETTIKYSKFLRILHDQGYPIYSFDMRGQGFSSATGDLQCLSNRVFSL